MIDFEKRLLLSGLNLLPCKGCLVQEKEEEEEVVMAQETRFTAT
jgi:hypothetical protein